MFNMPSSKFALVCFLTLSPMMAEAASPTLYGLAKRAGGADELFYDLTRPIRRISVELPIVARREPIHPPGHDHLNRHKRRLDPVPEPSTWALMIIGVLALATPKGGRIWPTWTRA